MSMPFASLDLSTNSPPRLTLYFASSLSPKSPSLVSLPIAPRHASVSARSLPSPAERRFRLAVFESEAPIDGADDGGFGFGFGFESFLSVVEALCALSSAALSIGFAVSCAASSSRKAAVAAAVGNRLLACGMVAMAAGIGVGAWIRRRQWQRLCAGAARGGSEVNLLERVGKLEEDLRSSAAIIRVMSRQLEKLGIRFRVTRKALKEPIAETAALAQKNSEATRALAIQEDMLEKELGEIQKVLLAMQEQQRKQLELILAIGKAGKLWETKPERSQEQDRIKRPDPTADGLKSKEAQQI